MEKYISKQEVLLIYSQVIFLYYIDICVCFLLLVYLRMFCQLQDYITWKARWLWTKYSNGHGLFQNKYNYFFITTAWDFSLQCFLNLSFPDTELFEHSSCPTSASINFTFLSLTHVSFWSPLLRLGRLNRIYITHNWPNPYLFKTSWDFLECQTWHNSLFHTKELYCKTEMSFSFSFSLGNFSELQWITKLGDSSQFHKVIVSFGFCIRQFPVHRSNFILYLYFLSGLEKYASLGRQTSLRSPY